MDQKHLFYFTKFNYQMNIVTTPAPPPATTPAPETTAVAHPPKYLGTFKNPSHDVEGDIFMLDEHTLYIQGFSFDGEAPDAYFWSDGVPIPYYTRYLNCTYTLLKMFFVPFHTSKSANYRPIKLNFLLTTLIN